MKKSLNILLKAKEVLSEINNSNSDDCNYIVISSIEVFPGTFKLINGSFGSFGKISNAITATLDTNKPKAKLILSAVTAFLTDKNPLLAAQLNAFTESVYGEIICDCPRCTAERELKLNSIIIN